MSQNGVVFQKDLVNHYTWNARNTKNTTKYDLNIEYYEVAGSIPGTSTILNVDRSGNGVHPASLGQLGSYLIEK